LNKQFVKVYTELLNVPEYIEKFDSHLMGSFYRYLTSKIWRQDLSSYSPIEYKQRLSVASELYEAGMLVTVQNDDYLSEFFKVTPRYLHMLRKNLVTLNLIYVSKPKEVEGFSYHDKNYLYKLGEWKYDEEGTKIEKLYIEKWVDEVRNIKHVEVKPEFIGKLCNL